MNNLKADDATGFAYYKKVANDSGGNIAFAFVGLGVIWLFSKMWLGAAKVLFWIAVVVVALSVVHFLFIAIMGVIAWATNRFAPPAAGQPSWKWLWAATAVRLLEEVLCLTSLWLAARVLGISIGTIFGLPHH